MFERLFKEDDLTLINKGNHQKIMKRLKKTSFLLPEAEEALFLRDNAEEMNAFLSHHVPMPKIVKKIIQRGRTEEIKLLLQQKDLHLDKASEEAIIARNNSSEMEFLLNFGLETQASVTAICESGNTASIEKLICHVPLCTGKPPYTSVCLTPQDIDTIIYSNNLELIECLLTKKRKCISEKNFVYLLNLDCKEIIIKAIYNIEPTEQIFQSVLNRGRADEVIELMTCSYNRGWTSRDLLSKYQMDILKRGVSAEICKLIVWFEVSEEFVEKVLERNNEKEIKLLISRHQVKEDMLFSLAERKKYAVLRNYYRYQPCNFHFYLLLDILAKLDA